MITITVLLAILALALILLGSSVRIITQYERGVVFRFGRVLPETRGPGLALIAPIADRLHKVNMQIITQPVPAQRRHHPRQRHRPFDAVTTTESRPGPVAVTYGLQRASQVASSAPTRKGTGTASNPNSSTSLELMIETRPGGSAIDASNQTSPTLTMNAMSPKRGERERAPISPPRRLQLNTRQAAKSDEHPDYNTLSGPYRSSRERSPSSYLPRRTTRSSNAQHPAARRHHQAATTPHTAVRTTRLRGPIVARRCSGKRGGRLPGQSRRSNGSARAWARVISSGIAPCVGIGHRSGRDACTGRP